jgi:hypothetical protein
VIAPCSTLYTDAPMVKRRFSRSVARGWVAWDTEFCTLPRVEACWRPEGGESDIREAATGAARETARPDKPALTLEELGPYHLGTYFATVAMQKKLDGEAKEEVEDYQDLVQEHNAAIRETAGQDSS